MLTAGESHGPALVTLVEGLPSGVPVDLEQINRDLRRRQGGYGRGGRMKIEQDRVQVLGGLRHGQTIGSPVALMVENKDFANWTEAMSPTPVAEFTDPRTASRRVTRPRPGHADLVGSLKYDYAEARNALERASARETAMRVAAGSLARQVLSPFGITVFGHVVAIGGVAADLSDLSPADIAARAEESPVRCADAEATRLMMAEIDAAQAAKDSLGGLIEVIATGLPPGLGSHVHWDRKLDGALAGALLSIQGMKAVQFGLGFELANRWGSAAHDPIAWNAEVGYYRTSNRAGGTEGGMSTGMPLVVQVGQKPIATLMNPLTTVDMDTHQPAPAKVERSDTCAVAAGAVICECVTAFVIAQFFLAKFGGDSFEQLRENYESYMVRIRRR